MANNWIFVEGFINNETFEVGDVEFEQGFHYEGDDMWDYTNGRCGARYVVPDEEGPFWDEQQFSPIENMFIEKYVEKNIYYLMQCLSSSHYGRKRIDINVIINN